MTREVTLGRISGLHGVRGWIKVLSYTDPPHSIGNYPNWVLQLPDARREANVEQVQQDGNRIRAKLAGIDDRDLAAAWVGASIVVDRQQLPPTADGEYYWADLVGLEVIAEGGQSLGRVTRLMETGANDVLVVSGDRERLIPWLPGSVIQEVDLENGRLRVDWEQDF